MALLCLIVSHSEENVKWGRDKEGIHEGLYCVLASGFEPETPAM